MQLGGQALPMHPNYATPGLLDITYRADLEVLIGRWGYQPDPAALPAEYERLEAAALSHRALCWLQDIRRRTLNDPHITQWLLHEYFPNMAHRLGGRLQVAYLVSPTLHDAIVAQPDFLPTESYADRPFAIGFFGEEGAAVAWLQAQ
jgi:hypothetical protein